MLDTVIAANRFGLGARPGELQRIGSEARGWLAGQIVGQRPTPQAIAALPRSAEVFQVYRQTRQELRDARKRAAADPKATKRALASVRNKLAPIYLDQVAARYRVATTTEESFRERLLHFWTNHFAVSADKPQVAPLAATLENEAVRPHLTGRFADMLLAVESHPAMILYLDNQASIGPDSPMAQRASRRSKRRRPGINENLAREILELHTLGVDGGYTQADVTTFAEALTGWSIGADRGAGGPGEFVFREQAHQPGSRTILRKVYAEDGVAQPRAILNDLARHPATARHLSTKLVRHFVADDPPPRAIDRVTRAFVDSDGDLPTVHRALIDLPDGWTASATKFKTPHEFVLSAFRMIDHLPSQPRQILAPFQLLGQRPYTPGSPAGWPDIAGQWDGPDALLKRIEWANAFGKRAGARLQPLTLGAQALGTSLDDRTRTAIPRAASAAQGLTLLLASPEFQRR